MLLLSCTLLFLFSFVNEEGRLFLLASIKIRNSGFDFQKQKLLAECEKQRSLSDISPYLLNSYVN